MQISSELGPHLTNSIASRPRWVDFELQAYTSSHTLLPRVLSSCSLGRVLSGWYSETTQVESLDSGTQGPKPLTAEAEAEVLTCLSARCLGLKYLFATREVRQPRQLHTPQP
jgi:hypothetical protein